VNRVNLFLLKPLLGKVRISRIFVVWTKAVANCMILLIFMCQERILLKGKETSVVNMVWSKLPLRVSGNR